MGYSQNRLISAIYDLLLGSSTWEDILDVFEASFPDCAIIASADDLHSGANLAFAHRGLGRDGVAAYLSVTPARQRRLAALSNLDPYDLYCETELTPPHRIGGSVSDATAAPMTIGVVLLRERSRQLALEIELPADANAPGLRDQLVATLGDAATHFRRVFEIIGHPGFPANSGYLDGVVRDLPFSVFFVDAEMQIRYANSQALALRHSDRAPFTGAGGTLRAIDPEADATLRRLVERTLHAKRNPVAVLQLNDVSSGERYFAMARLAVEPNRSFQMHDAVLNPGPLIMLVVHSSTEVASLPGDILWRAFSLTDSEAALAEALVNGETLADHAKERQVSKQTLRNQLVGIMRKTGTRRQAELVALLTRLALTCP